MSLLMNFTDASGTEHTPATFRLVQLNIAAADKNIHLTFYAYKDLQAFADNKAPLMGGQKTYIITGQEFLDMASSQTISGTRYDDLAKASEGYALAKKDTPTGAVDQQGNPIMVSFFDGATQV